MKTLPQLLLSLTLAAVFAVALAGLASPDGPKLAARSVATVQAAG